MQEPTARRANYDDVLQAPPHSIAQVLFGVLHTHKRSIMHAATCSAVNALVGRTLTLGIDGPGGWLILKAPELHLGHEPDIVVPDIVGWRRDRPVLPGNDDEWTSVAPDWACEVLSPETQRIDRTDKLEIYLREQVRHVWLLDPMSEVLEVLRHNGEAWTRVAAHSRRRAHIEPFDAIELDVGLFWRF